MTKRIKTEAGYASFFVSWGWSLSLVALPVLATLLLVGMYQETPQGRGVPWWLSCIFYALVVSVQFLYFRYSRTVQQANQLSHRFVLWKWGFGLLAHMFIWFLLLAEHPITAVPLLFFALFIASHWTLQVVWNKDLDNKIKLY